MWVQCIEPSTWLGCADNSPEGFVTYYRHVDDITSQNGVAWQRTEVILALCRRNDHHQPTSRKYGWKKQVTGQDHKDVAREVTDNIASVFAVKPSHQGLNKSITHLCNKSDDGEHWHQCEWGENVECSAWKLVGDDVKQVIVQHAPSLHFNMHV